VSAGQHTPNAGSPKQEAVTQLDRRNDDAELLREVLDSVVSKWNPEIVQTDNPSYRRMLKARRDRPRSMLDPLGGPFW
jgi:hypothetical protein